MRDNELSVRQGDWSATRALQERLTCPGLVQVRRLGRGAPREWRDLPRREIQPRWMRAGRRVLAG